MASDGISAAARTTPVDTDIGSSPRAKPRRDALLSCLLYLTQQLGKPVSQADIRALCPIDSAGMTEDNFLHAAQRLGYKVGRSEIDLKSLPAVPTPFVLLCSGDVPPVVVASATRGNFTLVDVVAGKTRTVSADEVLELGYRVILIKAPSGAEAATGAAPLGRSAGTGWRSLFSERVRRVLGELVAASFIINVLALATPLFMMVVFNKIIGQGAIDTLNVLVIGMVVVYLFDFLLRAVRGYIASHTGARLDALISGEVVHHLVHLPFQHFERTPTGLIAERLRQLDVLRGFFTGQMPVLIIDLVFVAMFVAAIFFISSLMGWITVAAVPFFILLSWLSHRGQRDIISQNFMALAAKGSALSETVTNAVTVKSLGLESEIEKRWQGRVAAAAWTGFRANNLSNIVGTLGNMLQVLVVLLILYVGAVSILDNTLSIGALIAANILAGRALAPMRQVVAALHSLQSVQQAFRRLDEVMEIPTEVAPGELAPLPNIKGEIAFEHVFFRFEDDLPPALRDVDFRIEPGTVIGIIGPSGSGKTTLSNLLQGLYQPTNGRVLIDQTDIGHISPAQLRSQFGVVPQDVQLFAGSVRENIAMGVADKDPARVVAVARFVGAHGFIQRLPQGYNTIIGERGVGLSAGQRQLICIARALIRNPRIIILDEATSALDPATEEQLLRSLKRNARGRTIVMITHRVAPLAIADKVALVIDGRIERLGPPQDVIAYAKVRMADATREGPPQQGFSLAQNG
jgi:HlyB family type I secretion system ABC transporter